MLQTIVETLFFFHPAVWWLGNRTRQMRELCCDDEALAACGDPVVYATALLQLEEQRSVRVRLAMAFHGNGGSLKSRILRILDGGQSTPGIHRRDTIPLSLAGVAATLGIFLLPLPHVIAGRAAVVEQKPAIAKAQAEAAPQITQAKPKMAVAQSQRQEPTTPPTANEVVMPAAPVAPAFVPEITVAVPTSPTISVQIPVVPVVAIAPRVMTLTGVEPRIVINTVGITRTLASVRRIAVGAITTQARTIGESAPDKNYMEGMYALGYTDIDKIIAMKVQGITLDYAKRMSGYGAASADDLIALKTFGVTPEEADKLHAEGGGRTALKELVRYKIFKVTPEFVSEMKSAGFGELPPDKLVALRVQGVTPAFASSMRQRYPQITVDQLVQAKIFRIDDDFIATAKSHGFDSLSLEKLIRLRVSGVLDDNSVQR
jgi:hypothetical protein